ncbi:MAG: hypothetical protein ACOCXJ_00145 [Planctomycetota bacterium]
MSERPTSLARSWSILRACAAQPAGIAFNDLRRACDNVVASTLSRQLDQLQDLELVQRDAAGRYRLGSAFLAVARQAGGRDPADLLPPLLRSLSECTRASCSWWRREADAVVLVDREEWPEGFHHVRPGFRRPLTDTAFGSAVLAALSDQAWPRLTGAFPNPSHRNRASLKAEVARARAAGCCMREDAGAHGPITRICAAFGPDGAPIGSLGISIPTSLTQIADADALRQAVIDHAGRASALIQESQ